MPVVLLFSLGFWGFIWGIPGALLATPLTVTIMIVLRELDSTRWIPELLSNEPAERTPTPGCRNAHQGRPVALLMRPWNSATAPAFAESPTKAQKGIDDD